MRPPELQDLLDKLESQRAEVFQQVAGMSEEEAGQPPAEGEWSAKQQLAHLAEAERGWVSWALQVRDSPGGTAGPPGEGQWTTSQQGANARSKEELLNSLRAVREETWNAIGGLTAEELGRQGRHTRFGEMTVLQMLRALYRHDRMHIDQIAGRPSSFVPRRSD